MHTCTVKSQWDINNNSSTLYHVIPFQTLVSSLCLIKSCSLDFTINWIRFGLLIIPKLKKIYPNIILIYSVFTNQVDIRFTAWKWRRFDFSCTLTHFWSWSKAQYLKSRIIHENFRKTSQILPAQSWAITPDFYSYENQRTSQNGWTKSL